MIWATVSSWSCFCWLYRVSPSLAAKNIVNLISVLTIWWCPCIESSLVLLEEGVCYDQYQILEFNQTHGHRLGDATQPSHPLVPFFSCLQDSPASGSFQMSQFFASHGQSIGVSASASVLPMNIQDWFLLGWTGWISLQSMGSHRVRHAWSDWTLYYILGSC